MRRKARIIVVTAALAVTLCACGKKSANGTGNVTPANTAEVTFGAMATPTVTETLTPTVTPDPEKMSIEELVARNREIRETVSPKLMAHPLGTAPVPSGQEKQDLAYGITRAGAVTVKYVGMETGEEFDSQKDIDDAYYQSFDGFGQSYYLRIDGLKDGKMQKLINERLESVARSVRDGGFLPSYAGVMPRLMPIIKERGLPMGRVCEYVKYNEKGILSIAVEKCWYWEEERTFADDTVFQEFRDNLDWPYGFDYEITDGYWFIWNSPVKLRYSLYETFYININLATGEDLALSDVFPEGFDYLSKLNAGINNDYEYWFYHNQQDTSDWETYHPEQEYDGGLAKTGFTGDEMFYLNSGCLNVATKWGGEISFAWDKDRIAAKSLGENVYSDTTILDVGPVASVGFSAYTWRVKEKDRIGSFTTEQDGRKLSISVFRDRDYPEWFGRDSEDEYVEAAEKLVTDEAIVKFAKQAFERGLMYCDTGSSWDILLTDVDVYGNGCYKTHWRADSADTETYGSSRKEFLVWIWDGECHDSAELLSMPFEDLLTDIILTLYWEDSEGSQNVVSDRAEAESLAKALRKFSCGYGGSAYTPVSYIYWQDYSFQLGEDGEVLADPDFLSASMPWLALSDLEQYLPSGLWKRIDGALRSYKKLKCSDPFVVTKHLRMYEGYSFE